MHEILQFAGDTLCTYAQDKAIKDAGKIESLIEAVEELEGDIEAQKKRGITFDEIAKDIFSHYKGLDIEEENADCISESAHRVENVLFLFSNRR